MTSFRDHVEALRRRGDTIVVAERTHWADLAVAVATEAAEANGPAVVMTETGGGVDLVSGAYGGTDQMTGSDGLPWGRLANGLGLSEGLDYRGLIDSIIGVFATRSAPVREPLAATERDCTLRSLGLPILGDQNPTITLGLASIRGDNRSVWSPVRGTIHRSDRLRVSLPTAAADSLDTGTPVTIALGVPIAAYAMATAQWGGRRAGRSSVSDARLAASALDGVALADCAGGDVPSSSEVVVETRVIERDVAGTERRVARADRGVSGDDPREGWELTTSTRGVELEVMGISTRDDPTVPFSPLGAAMADDVHVAGLVESARLHHRINNYWGADPVEWIALPAEARLGICLVASEILYAGFEWQLANALFSFSPLFDKIIVLDAETPPDDRSQAFDDVWVKAHPAHDWTFSESDAPPATVPAYRHDGRAGSRVYVNAAWDPGWDEEYIAPQVSFEQSYPKEIRDAVRERWGTLGFETESVED